MGTGFGVGFGVGFGAAPSPSCLEQDGQAVHPCQARIRSATAICCVFVARSGRFA
ncbi:hypothetical protein [Streptacidiphilus sp. PAMC 29251]